MSALVTITLVLLLVSGLCYFAYWYWRKILRTAKNYERGLKMVPVLIHPPPSSEDIDGQSRDERDVVEETISKAEVLYNIIASTAKKGFKNKFYGQRHIAFEIIAHKGIVKFYVAVPVTLLPVVKQAITSAYPSASLEEVQEHNFFSPVGKISGTFGGELSLKQHFAYPIATFQESKRDTMQALLNSLYTLDKEDGAGIQILFRPAYSGWPESARRLSKKVKEDKLKKSTKGGNQWKGVAGALWKPPEIKEGSAQTGQLSSLEQSIIDAVDDKTRHPGYEVLIRVIASSNISAKAQSIMNNVVSAFSLFDAPGKNGFKLTPARDIESFVTSFIFRFFPQEANKTILNSVELATLFHLPDQKHTPTSQLTRQSTKQVDGPNNVPDKGQLLGVNEFRGIKKEIRLTDSDRRRHMYMIGQTGVGKSVFLKNLALQDMLDGRGFAFVDPHGDAAEDIMGMVPKERTEDVIYFSPGDMEYPIGLNLFEFQSSEQKDFLIQEAINMLYKLYDPNRQGMMGPRFEHMFRNAALAIMSGPNPGTFVDIPKLFTDKQFLNNRLKYVTDQTVLDFWLKEVPASERSSDYGEVKAWVTSKFGAFLSNEMMRNIIGQEKSGFDIRKIMDEGKILLVNLSKGRTGELNAKLLGMIFVMKFYAAAMGRANVDESERRDFTLYVDEFQNFSTETFSDILSEARKYRLSLTVANQFIGQLTDEIRDAVFGNVGTVVSGRTSANDADFLVKFFSPIFETDDLVKMPNHQAAVRVLIDGVPSEPFSMTLLPPLGKPNKRLKEALQRLSDAKYGRPKTIVEKEIFERLSTPEPLRPSFGAMSSGSAGMRGRGLGDGQSGGLPTPKSASFLDEWLAKKKAAQRQSPAAPKTSQPTNTGTLDNSSQQSPQVNTPQASNKQSTDESSQVEPAPNEGKATPTSSSSIRSAGQQDTENVMHIQR